MLEVIILDDENRQRGFRKHRHYEKPSERRKHKQAAARRKGRRERYWA